MAAPYLGLTEITAVEWTGPGNVRVEFRRDEEASLHVQVYVGRRLAGVTQRNTDRVVYAHMPGGITSAPLTLLCVTEAQRLTDYGSQLGTCIPSPLWCLTWSETNASSDLKHFDVALGTSPGGAYDASNVIARVPFQTGITSYSYDLPPFTQSGTWQAAIIPRDDARPSGNAGTVQTADMAVTIPPADVQLNADGTRFTASVSSGTLTLNFTCP